MGKPTGFLEFERHDRVYEPVADRIIWRCRIHDERNFIDLRVQAHSQITQIARRNNDFGQLINGG